MSSKHNILIVFIRTSRTFLENISKKYYIRAHFKMNFPLIFVDLIRCIYSATYRLSGYAKANSHGTCWFNYGSVHIPSAPILPVCAYGEEHPPRVCVHRASININQIVQTWYWRLLYVVIDVIMTRHA